MIVGVCGFGSTGSGAVMDFLREFEEVSAGRNMELSFLYDPDGILEMENRLVKNPIRFYSGDAAIKRFRDIVYSYDLTQYVKRYMSLEKFRQYSEEYISDLIVTECEGSLWHFDRRRADTLQYILKYRIGGKYLRIFDKLHIEQPEKFFNHKMYIPVHDERFYTATRKYITNLLNEMCDFSKEIVAIDQPFPSNNPECCFKFFDHPCKAIIVNRDPRDLYLLSKVTSVGWEMRFTPTKHVKDFISYYRDQMSLLKYNTKNVLYIQFEDLIYEYDSTIKKIMEFLNICKHVSPKKHFDPSISIANTQLILRYPNLKKDIYRIESELSEYLYKFDESRADLSAKTWQFKKD